MVSMVLSGDWSGPMRCRCCWPFKSQESNSPKQKKSSLSSVSSSGLDLLSVLASEFRRDHRYLLTSSATLVA
jgi:hypothetical protein